MWGQEDPTGEVISIIGGGWYGCAIADDLKKKYPEYRVVVFEKNEDIFNGVSGRFGYRMHDGEHYPRSDLTQKLCRESSKRFSETYPELVNNDTSLYVLGITDANGKPPKVTTEEFRAVCNAGKTRELTLEGDELQFNGRRYCNISYAAEVDEPSLAMGERLRESFKNKLRDSGVEVYCNFEVKSIVKYGKGFCITNTQGKSFYSNHVINATGYQTLVTKPLSSFFNIDIVYQPCLALVYQYCSNLPAPLSFIVMDGAFPSLTRYDTRVFEHEPFSYVLTHVEHSMLKAYDTLEEAQKRLSTIDNDINEIRRKCELAIKEFYPAFGEEFMYLNYESTVLAKVVTDEAFRGAFVVRDPQGIITTFPGKISHIPNIAAEAAVLMEEDSEDSTKVINNHGFWFAKGGMFDRANTVLFSNPTAKPSTSTGVSFPQRKTSASNQSDISQSLFEKNSFFKSSYRKELSAIPDSEFQNEKLYK